MKSFFSFLFLILAVTLVTTVDVDAQKTKTKKTTKKKDSEYVPDDYVPDDYVPDDYAKPEATPKAKNSATNSSTKSTTPKTTGPKTSSPVIVAAQDTVRKPDPDAPMDDIIKRDMIKQKLVLGYEPLNERDIFWERRIWRVIDCREKMNLPFKYPDHEFYTILKKGIENGDIRCYTDESFQFRASTEDINKTVSGIDTSEVYNPETGQYESVITKNDFDPQLINQFRVKEVWYFDSESSTMKVRILGIAPLYVKIDQTTGVALPAMPLFWIYYPDCRKYLSQHQVFNEANIASPVSWDDMFENRHFSSFITKKSNVNDFRLVDYDNLRENGVDMLLESNKIKEEIFNFEHDLWSY
ncbi:MAG TPA: gliding motility protein GldN [Saprospiraceae bacterium]|nr:gliding motility protein GldN [Saprospiraceae bacterium]HRP85670.1 gliding motility protein GldN [Saprospiraceae bacterium]